MPLTNERLIAGRMALRGFAPQLDPDWDSWMNENLLRISALASLTVISLNTALPADPPAGSIYIVPSDATSNANEVAVRDDNTYSFFAPWPGLQAWSIADDAFFFYNEVNTAWEKLVPEPEIPDVGTTLPSNLTGLAGQRFVVNGDEDGVVAQEVAYDIPVFVGGFLEPGGGIRFLISRDMFIPTGMAGSRAMLTTPPDAPLTISLRRNGVEFATLDFATGAPGGTFTGPVSRLDFTAGDLIEVVFPDPANAVASGLSLTILGNQR